MKAISEISNVAKTESIQDAVSAVVKALGRLISLLKQLQNIKDILLNGKKRIEKSDFNSPELGMKEIWIEQERCLLKLRKNTFNLRRDERNEMRELRSGRKKIQKNAGRMIGQCMQSRQENLLDLINVLNALRNANLMHIMRIIPNLLMSFGFVLYVTFTYIINQNITVREQARKLQMEMRCSEPLTKAVEIRRNDVSAIEKWLASNRKWQAGGKARFIYLPPGYNNDPLVTESQQYADIKSFLIDLDLLTRNGEDNKAQAEQYALAA